MLLPLANTRVLSAVLQPPSTTCSVHLQSATRFGLILLLFGTIIGDFALLADVGTRAVQRLHTAHTSPAPAWLVGSKGRVIMVLLAACPVFPLCCSRRLDAVA